MKPSETKDESMQRADTQSPLRCSPPASSEAQPDHRRKVVQKVGRQRQEKKTFDSVSFDMIAISHRDVQISLVSDPSSLRSSSQAITAVQVASSCRFLLPENLKISNIASYQSTIGRKLEKGRKDKLISL